MQNKEITPKVEESKIPLITTDGTLIENKNPIRTMINALLLFVGEASKFLHKLFTKHKTAVPLNVQNKKDQILQDLAPPKPAESKSPLINAEEKTVEEYKQALSTLIEEEKNLPVVIHSENNLPAIDEEHREFLNDLKTLEKEGKRKYKTD